MKAERRAASLPPPAELFRPLKKQITVRLDADVLAWLKAGGPGYQSRINGILRAAMPREAKR